MVPVNRAGFYHGVWRHSISTSVNSSEKLPEESMILAAGSESTGPEKFTDLSTKAEPVVFCGPSTEVDHIVSPGAGELNGF